MSYNSLSTSTRSIGPKPALPPKPTNLPPPHPSKSVPSLSKPSPKSPNGTSDSSKMGASDPYRMAAEAPTRVQAQVKTLPPRPCVSCPPAGEVRVGGAQSLPQSGYTSASSLASGEVTFCVMCLLHPASFFGKNRTYFRHP